MYRYAVLVTKAVIPKAFWGSDTNFKHVLRRERFIPRHLTLAIYTTFNADVKNFITCRRYESLSLHHIVQGFSTSACEWLMPPGSGECQTRVTVSDALKRRELLEDFLFWYFDSFLLPLLKVCFHSMRTSPIHVLMSHERLHSTLRNHPLFGITSSTSVRTTGSFFVRL